MELIELAIRECVINAVLHRDYSFNASTIIHVFTNRIEIVSLGGIYGDLELSDLLTGGMSITRNPKLQSLLLRINKVESLGTGISRIIDNYKYNDNKPEFIISQNKFIIVLPKLIKSSMEDNKILIYLNTHEYITREFIEELLNVGKSTASNMLRKLVDANIVLARGKGRGIKYYLNK